MRPLGPRSGSARTDPPRADGRRELWTFAELSDASARLATAWRRAGLKQGDRIAAVCGKGVESTITPLAAWRGGFVHVPLFVGFGAEALAERLRGAEPAAVVVGHEYRATVTDALARLDRDIPVVTVAGPKGRGIVVGDHSFWAEIDAHAADAPPVATGPQDPATLIYTSGTTGRPKGCLMPHSVLLCGQPFLRHVLALQPCDLLFSGADPGWNFGLYTTGTAVMSVGRPRLVVTGPFDRAGWLRAWREERVTYVAAAPSAYRRLAAAARRGGLPAGLRGGLSAGETLDGPTATAWRALGGGVLQDAYGQSELGMVLATQAGDEPGALGAAVPGCEVGLLGADGEIRTEPCAEGTIVVRGMRCPAGIGYRGSRRNGRPGGTANGSGPVISPNAPVSPYAATPGPPSPKDGLLDRCDRSSYERRASGSVHCQGSTMSASRSTCSTSATIGGEHDLVHPDAGKLVTEADDLLPGTDDLVGDRRTMTAGEVVVSADVEIGCSRDFLARASPTTARPDPLTGLGVAGQPHPADPQRQSGTHNRKNPTLVGRRTP